jgi:hypothetical protein
MSIITSILFLVSLTFFGWLSIKSKSIKTFQSQISLFIGLYVIGELLEIKQISTLLSIPDGLGSQIHVVATIFLTIIVWMRLYYSEKGIKNLTDAPNNDDIKT